MQPARGDARGCLVLALSPIRADRLLRFASSTKPARTLRSGFFLACSSCWPSLRTAHPRTAGFSATAEFSRLAYDVIIDD
jgi:hypothetical protein